MYDANGGKYFSLINTDSIATWFESWPEYQLNSASDSNSYITHLNMSVNAAKCWSNWLLSMS